jgi:hypothetical protein
MKLCHYFESMAIVLFMSFCHCLATFNYVKLVTLYCVNELFTTKHLNIYSAVRKRTFINMS